MIWFITKIKKYIENALSGKYNEPSAPPMSEDYEPSAPPMPNHIPV